MQRFGLKPHGKLMALIGNGEESDWDGMERYVASRQHAPKVISVDAGYPVVVAESGFVRWELLLPPSQAVANDDCLEPVDVHAGEFLTQVPQVARLTIAAEGDVEDKLGRLQSAADREGAHRGAGWPLSAAREAGSLVLQAEGLAVHSSTAPDGRNALWALARAAQELELCPGAVRSMLELVARYLADDHWGQKLGLVQRDPLMGRLLVIPTMIRSDDKGVLLRVNMRRPAPMSSADFNRELDAVLARLAARYPRLHEPTDRYVGEPAWVDPSSRLVQTLLAIYREETGDDEAVPIAIRGGTYARLFEGAVSFGPSLPGKPYRGHAPNEYLEVDALALLINSLYKAAIRLDAPR